MVGLALLLTISLTSHSATELHPFLPILGDWVHLVGMAFWFGGLAHLIIGLTIMKKAGGGLQTSITSVIARRFSLLALPSVVVIGLTGVYSAFLRVGSIAALLDTMYGASLLFKQGFVAALLLIATVNFLIISPGLRRDSLQDIPNSKFFQRFVTTVLAEIILACVLLISVSWMTYLPPAVIPLPSTTLEGASTADDLRVGLLILPGLVGQNDFEVQLSPSKLVKSVKSVSLRFVTVEVNIPPSTLDLPAQGNGLFAAKGSHLVAAGHWLVEVTVQRQGRFDVVLTFDFNVPKSGPAVESTSSSISLVSKILIVMVVFLIGLNNFSAADSILPSPHGFFIG